MVVGSFDASPTIMRLKKIPIESTWAEILEGGVHARPRAAIGVAAGCSSRRPGWARRTTPMDSPSMKSRKANGA